MSTETTSSVVDNSVTFSETVPDYLEEEESGDSLSLPGLQTLLTEEYGETHFNAAEQPLLYFQV